MPPIPSAALARAVWRPATITQTSSPPLSTRLLGRCSVRHSSMKAFVVHGKGGRVDPNRAIPRLAEENDNHVLVKPVAVALNPTDWRHLEYGRAKDGCIVGCDYAGIVESVGSAVTKGWKPGDKIYGCAHGANLVNPDDGVFAEYASVVGDLQMRLPEDRLSFEEAATLGLGAITVGQGLFQKALKLDLPTTAAPAKKDIPVLIYGGGTATGALGIQYARQAGYTVITTCSKSNFDYVKSLGAELAIDYHDADAGKQIREYTNNRLFHAWDTVSVPASAQICADALSTEKHDAGTGTPPVYGTLLPVQSPRDDVKSVATVMYTVFGKQFQFGPVNMPASQEDYEFGKKFYALTEELVAAGLVKPHAYRVGKGGLNGIAEGLDSLRLGKVKAEKLVYRLADTA